MSGLFGSNFPERLGVKPAGLLAGPGGAGARPGREPDSARPAGSLRPAPSPDEKCYLCAWHKVLPMSRSAHFHRRTGYLGRSSHELGRAMIVRGKLGFSRYKAKQKEAKSY